MKALVAPELFQTQQKTRQPKPTEKQATTRFFKHLPTDFLLLSGKQQTTEHDLTAFQRS
jgi:hypothetical protein